VRKIIDGNYRKQFADEFGYSCPEIVQEGLDKEEKRVIGLERVERYLEMAREGIRMK
jgi:hypothetical protein